MTLDELRLAGLGAWNQLKERLLPILSIACLILSLGYIIAGFAFLRSCEKTKQYHAEKSALEKTINDSKIEIEKLKAENLVKEKAYTKAVVNYEKTVTVFDDSVFTNDVWLGMVREWKRKNGIE